MKINSISEIGNRVTPTIAIVPYNVSFEEIDENDCYKFAMLKTTYDDIFGCMPYVCHGFDLESIDQATYTQKEKGIIRKIDKSYTGNYIREVDTNYRLYTEPMEVAINRG